MNSLRAFRVGLASALLAAVLTGCGATNRFTIFSPDFHPTTASRFLVAPVVDAADPIKRTDLPADFSPPAELHLKIEQKLTPARLASDAAAPDVIVLKPTINDYDPGNAAVRWMAPGAGATVLIVSTKVVQNGVEMGTIKSRRTIEFGGVYSIGQWKAIFDPSADDIVDALKSKIKNK